jgi:hypothetical protein
MMVSRLRTVVVASAASAVCVTALLLAPGAGARVANDPCPDAGRYTFDGHSINDLTPHQLYDAHSSYRQCAHENWLGHIDRHFGVICEPGFKLAGTSQQTHDAHTAQWDFWAKNGEWVLWHGAGRFEVAVGNWAIGYHALLHNWNFIDLLQFESRPWPIRMFATCDRIPGYWD